MQFPSNRQGLRNGSLIKSAHKLVEEQLGIKVGEAIALHWDGEYVTSGLWTWSLAQLCNEIEGGYWEVVTN
jgi:hypothetical protein